MAKAGRHTAMYSAPPSAGVEYWIHSPLWAMTAWPAATSSSPFLCFTRSVPLRTMVNSSNSGVCPGSSQPCGLRMWATLTPEVRVLTRPMNSSISLGLVPAARMRVGCATRVGMVSPREAMISEELYVGVGRAPSPASFDLDLVAPATGRPDGAAGRRRYVEEVAEGTTPTAVVISLLGR